MNDEKTIAAAIHAGLQSDDVTDLYSGDCRGCGECCSRFLPVSPFDRVRLEAYVRRNGIVPAEPRAEYDLLCPYLTDGREWRSTPRGPRSAAPTGATGTRGASWACSSARSAPR